MKKGETNNPNGRPAGVPNKITKELRSALKAAVSDELEALPGLLAGLEPKERLELLVKLLPYTLPKIESQAATHDEPFNLNLDFD